MNNGIYFLIIWWVPIFITITVLMVIEKIKLKRSGEERVQSVYPEITYVKGKHTDLDNVGFALAYAIAVFLGPIMFFIIFTKEKKDGEI